MWQHLLDRFVPLMDCDASPLDRRDGVGGSIAPPASVQGRTADAPVSVGRTRTAFDGSASPLTS
jgi:hypothetical protein